MSPVDEVMSAYFVQGVAYAELRDLARTVSGLTGKTKADFSDGNARFVSYRNVFANLAVDHSPDDFVRVEPGEKQNRLERGDIIFTGSSENFEDVGMSSVVETEPEAPLYLNSFCFALRLHDQAILLPEFNKYLFRSEPVRAQIRKCASGVTRINISKERFMKVRVPLPPPDVQAEIAEVLDQLTRASSELESVLGQESDARESQRSRVRDAVLDRGTSLVEETVRLEDVVEFTNGKPHERLVDPEGSIALLTARFISTSGRQARWVHSADALSPARIGDIAMVMSDLPNGRALARCFFIEEDGKYSANQRVCLLRVRNTERVSPRWLYHYLDRNPQLLAYDNGQDQTHLKKGQILDVRVPVLPVHEQNGRARTLDEIDSSISELVANLRDESQARRTEYEYYRDKLLTFEELSA